MMQKMIISFLAASLLGAVGVGVYDAAQQTESETPVLNEPAQTESTEPEPVLADPDPTAVPQQIADVNGQPVQQHEQIQASLDNVGQPWYWTGVIMELDDNGLTLDDGTYIELGPPTYWQAQTSLNIGDEVSIDGFYDGVNAHARTVHTKSYQLELRTETGQPLWSGGAQNGQAGQNGNTTEEQVAAVDWITLSGVIDSQQNNAFMLLTDDGETVILQLGQQRFLSEQGIVLMIGDAIEVSGFWQGTTFRVGMLLKTDTGERLLLLDPNGRPLWGGPGRNGNANGNINTQADGNAQAGGALSQNNQAQTNANATTTQSQRAGGRGYRGGR